MGRRRPDALSRRLPRPRTHVRPRRAASARRARPGGARCGAHRGGAAPDRVDAALPLAARSGNGGLLERARLALSLAACALAACRGDRGGGGVAFQVPGEGKSRVTVEVLNASGRPGLARLGTRVLRRAGLGVGGFGTTATETGPLDSTRIVVRRGTAE